VILTCIFPPDIGGPATSVPQIATSLQEHGHSPGIVTLAETTDSKADDPCEVVRIPRALPWPRRALAVVRAATAMQSDVVLANGLHSESALIRRVPVVQKVVGDWAWERARNAGHTDVAVDDFAHASLPVKAQAVRRLRTLVTRTAKLVIVPSEYLRSLVAHWGVDQDRVRVIPNAAPRISDFTHSQSRSTRALFVGRLVPWKHLDHAIEVLPRFRNLGLDVIGTGPAQRVLERVARDSGVEGRVSFLGAMPRDAVLNKMRTARFLVLPSSYEGMPHVVLEAFASGLPVVASDVGGIPELVNDRATGFLYEFGNRDALCKAVRAAMDDDGAVSVAHAAAQVASRLTPSLIAKETGQALKDVARAEVG
jgi:glycosyltransferase involved in cell wall biosynthesis